MKIPPTIGAAILFITSAPVPVAQRIGTRPRNVVATVMNFGRILFAAPMVGGLATSFLLELLVYPAIYFLWKSRSLPAEPAI